jgi:hypothetical protein
MLTSLDVDKFGCRQVWLSTSLDVNKFGCRQVWLSTSLDVDERSTSLDVDNKNVFTSPPRSPKPTKGHWECDGVLLNIAVIVSQMPAARQTLSSLRHAA